jgi:hypothetical protein
VVDAFTHMGLTLTTSAVFSMTSLQSQGAQGDHLSYQQFLNVLEHFSRTWQAKDVAGETKPSSKPDVKRQS